MFTVSLPRDPEAPLIDETLPSIDVNRRPRPASVGDQGPALAPGADLQ
ncbi:Hypothetical protein A7982_10324 [Minicystis rosea]|nr:Hypothetical protein A7982_10324 [Minicystis rosea]